jgi:hypothetical protein
MSAVGTFQFEPKAFRENKKGWHKTSSERDARLSIGPTNTLVGCQCDRGLARKPSTHGSVAMRSWFGEKTINTNR